MPAPVRIVFVSEGAAAVKASFQSIAKSAQELSRLQAAEARKVTSINRQAATEKVKANTDADKKNIDAAKNAEKIRERSAIMAGKFAANASKAEAREAANATKALDREAQRRMKINERSALMAGKIAKTQADNEIREWHRTAQAIEREDRSRGKAVAGILGRGVRSGVGTVMGIGAGLGIAGGMGMLQTALTSSVSLDTKARLLSNAAAMPGFAPQDPRDLMAQARSTAGKTGFKSEDVMGAMEVVSARAGGAPGLAKLRGDLDDIALTAKGAGVSMEEMGGVYAAAMNAGIKPGEEVRQLMMDLVMVGKQGSVEFKDLASELPRLVGAGLQTELKGGKMVRRQVGMAEIAVRQGVTKEAARTATQDVINDMQLHSATMKRNDIGLYGKDGMKDPAVVLANIIDKAETTGLKGKMGRHAKGEGALFGGEDRIFTGTSKMVATEALKMYREAGGGEAGKKAIIKQFDDAGGGTMNAAQRNAEAQKVIEGPEARFAIAMENFKTKIGELLPRLTELLPTVTSLMEGFAKLAVWLGENPYQGIAAVISASVAKEIGASLLGKGIESAISASLSKAGGGLTATGAIAITAIAGVTIMTMENMQSDEAKGRKLGTETLETDMAVNRARARMKEAKEGKGAPMTREELYGIADVVGKGKDVATKKWKAQKEAEDASFLEPWRGVEEMGAKKTAGGVNAERLLLDSEKLAADVAAALSKIKLEVTVTGVPMSDPGNSDRNGKPPTAGATTRMGVSH